jgi:hypothetical protein
VVGGIETLKSREIPSEQNLLAILVAALDLFDSFRISLLGRNGPGDDQRTESQCPFLFFMSHPSVTAGLPSPAA